jgi:sodium transport system ATP-binding protein
VIEARNLVKTFRLSGKRRREKGADYRDGLVRAADSVSFTCLPGRVFSLLGPNGAGKTTILRVIATLMRPTSGTVEVAGYDTVRQARQARASLGFLTGSTRLYDRLTPNELVKYYADLHGMDRHRFRERRDELFSLLSMEEFADRRIGKLSSGMKQKVSIVRTVIHDPAVVIFDEPTTGLDVLTSRSIMELIRRCRTDGKTVIFSTHIMSEVSLLSDDLAILHRGRLVYCGDYRSFTEPLHGGSVEEEFIRVLKEAEA